MDSGHCSLNYAFFYDCLVSRTDGDNKNIRNRNIHYAYAVSRSVASKALGDLRNHGLASVQAL